MNRGSAAAGLVLASVMTWSMAAAADDMRKEPRPDPYAYDPGPPSFEYNWSGLYVGGHLGAAYTQWDWTFTNPLETIDQSTTGFAGGAQIGLQKQWGRVIIGAELDYTWLDAERTSGSSVAFGTSRAAEVTNLLLATGRLGVAQDNLLAYAKGGYATADVDFRSSITNGVVTTSSSEREHGWVAGVGMEYGFTSNISIGVEYNYIHLNVEGRDQVPTPAGLAGSQVSDGGIDIQSVMARLNFRFGPSAELFPLK